MNRISAKIIVSLFAIVLACVALSSCSREKTTLDNLMTAFNGESNANARYLAFAKKADEEEYGRAASLFRAAARAEQVHFEREAAAIKKLGGTAKATLETPVVKTTRENLDAAFKGETYETDVMYPGFLVKAQKDGDKEEAVGIFEHAKAAEAVHAYRYKAALDSIDHQKGPKQAFYVCPVCGNVENANTGTTCTICGAAVSSFIMVD